MEEPKPDTPTVETPKDKVEEPKDKVGEPKPDTPTVETPKDKIEEPEDKVEEPKDKVGEPKPDTPTVETPKDKIEEPKDKVGEPKPDTPTVETPAVEEPKNKVEEPKPDTPTVETPAVEEPKNKVEEPKPDTPTVETPKDKVDEPKNKVEEPKPDAPTVETPKEPTKVSETTQDTIKYQQTIVKDATLLKGERKLVQVGKEGVKDVIRTWSLKDGQKIGEPTVNEVIKTPAVDEIIHVGTREDLMEIDFEKTPSGGSRAVMNFYSIAEGKRVGQSRRYLHILRVPTRVTQETRETIREVRQNPVKTELAIKKLYANLKFLR